MQPERWQQIETVFHAALRLKPEERAVYLAAVCASDEELLKEVESLVSSFESGNSLLAEPAFSLGLRVLTTEPAGPAVGQTIGPYKILGLLGKGGMGEVYLAKDSDLGRKVALKLLPSSLTSDSARVHRFQQEARAAISHPNVAHIYGTGLVDGRHYIAMEFVDGVTLRQRLSHGPLDVREAVHISLKIADALAAAHERSIIHRDVKPENVMIRSDGLVKILDFGLAKLNEEAAGQVGLSSDTSAGQIIETDPGMVMGTVRYMSPEQLRGQPVGDHVDVWSLGAVLYEMVAGLAPFEGPTPNDEIALILQREPPALALPPGDASTEFSRVVNKALSKELANRYQKVEEFASDLRRLHSRFETEREPALRTLGAAGPGVHGTGSSAEAILHGEWQTTRAKAGAARIFSSASYMFREIKQHKKETFSAVAVLAIVAGYVFAIPQLFPARHDAARRFQDMKITPLSNTGKAARAAVSPDGEHVAHVEEVEGRQMISVTHTRNGETLVLEQAIDVKYQGLTFSRDGRHLYYVRYEDSDAGILYQVALLDGATKKLLDGVDSPISFAPDGESFAFVRFEKGAGEYSLMIAKGDGTGEYTLAAKRAGNNFSLEGPAWSPDGTMVVCATGWWSNGHHMSLVGFNVENGREVSISGRQWFSILQVAWIDDQSGMVICAADRPMSPYQLWEVSYPRGEAVKVTNDTADYNGVSLSRDTGMLVSVQSNRVSQVWVAPVSDTSRAKAIVSKVGLSYGVVWTSDEKIVFSSMVGSNLNISAVNPDGSQLKQLTFDSGDNYHPTLSSDGRYIIFSSNRSGTFNIWRMNAADGGDPRQLTFSDGNFYPSCSADNQWVFYDNQSEGQTTIWKVPLEGGDAMRVSDDYGRMPVISPDNQFIASRHYVSEDKLGIALLPFSGGAPIKLLPIPIIEWQRVHWTRDGGALTYIKTVDGVSNIWRYSLDGDRTRQLTNFGSEKIYSYAWSPDFRQLACVRGTVISDMVTISGYR